MEQAVRVRGAGPGVAGPPGQVGQPGELVDQIRAEQAKVPVAGMLVVQAGLQHDRVEGEHPGVVGDEQRTPGGRHVLEPAHLDPEPLLVQQPGQRDQQPGIEFRVESELVDLTLAGDLAPGEPQRLGQPAAPVIAGFPAGGAVGLGTAIVGGPAWGHPGKPRRASLPDHRLPFRCARPQRPGPAASGPAASIPTAGASTVLLLVPPLHAGLPQQLAVLLLCHSLAALLDNGAHDTTLTRDSGTLACDVFARCQPAGPTPTPQGTCPTPAPVMPPRGNGIS